MINTFRHFLVVILTVIAATGFSQSDTAFYQLSDATGYAADLQSQQLANLHAAAISLREALPQEFQSDFAVYDLVSSQTYFSRPSPTSWGSSFFFVGKASRSYGYATFFRLEKELNSCDLTDTVRLS